MSEGKVDRTAEIIPTDDVQSGTSNYNYDLLLDTPTDDFKSQFQNQHPDSALSQKFLDGGESDEEIFLDDPFGGDAFIAPEESKGSLSFRAVLVGCLIGALVSAMNVNFGLRTGWTQGGSIFAALVAIGIFKVLQPVVPYTKYETVITTTTASAAGTMTSAAGLVSSIPALALLGHKYNVGELLLWALSVAYFGVYFAIPLRKQMLEIDQLAFPSGTATAKTIEAMFATKSNDTLDKAKVLMYVAIFTALFSLVGYFIPYIEQPPLPQVLHDWGWVIYFNPLLIGGGMLSGLRACSSLLMGSILGWGILGPIVHYNKWVNGKVLEYNGVRGWILWVGVAIMTADSFVQLLFSIKFIISGIYSLFIRIKSTIKRENRFVADTPGQIPASWWLIGLLISSIALTLVGHFIFDLKWYFILLAIPLSFLLSVIAVRCTGETDINPVGGMGKVTQLAYAVVAPHQVTTNLLAAGIVGAGASQAGDMMQDLKTGYLVRVTPRNQFIAQCIGIVAGIAFCVPIFKLFDSAYIIGGEQIPAPAAHAWKAVAVILAKGLEELPLYSGWGILGGIIFGIVVGLINRIAGLINKNWPSYLPSALAFGIGMVVPPKQSLTMFFGAMFSLIWKWASPASHLNYFFAVSSGLIAGEGLMGIFTALLKLAGVQPLVK